jgi:hypothetical protein
MYKKLVNLVLSEKHLPIHRKRKFESIMIEKKRNNCVTKWCVMNSRCQIIQGVSKSAKQI